MAISLDQFTGQIADSGLMSAEEMASFVAGLPDGDKPLESEQVLEAVAEIHELEPEEYVGFRSLGSGREMAAPVSRRYTRATLAELSARFGLRHPDSSANLVRRARRQEEESASYRRQIARAEAHLAAKTEHQV
jgi:hypothetical protein